MRQSLYMIEKKNAAEASGENFQVESKEGET